VCQASRDVIGAETIFPLGEQKLNDFSAGEAKIGEKQSRQPNSKYNFLQYVFFEKKDIRSTVYKVIISSYLDPLVLGLDRTMGSKSSPSAPVCSHSPDAVPIDSSVHQVLFKCGPPSFHIIIICKIYSAPITL